MKYVPECLRNLPSQKSKSADSKRRKSARDIAGMTIAQTEQRPVRLPQRKNLDGLLDPASKRAGMAYNEALEDVELLNTPPIAQTAPQPVATWMGTDWNAQQQLIAHLCKLEPGTDLYAAPHRADRQTR